jgi:hypothetical protein
MKQSNLQLKWTVAAFPPHLLPGPTELQIIIISVKTVKSLHQKMLKKFQPMRANKCLQGADERTQICDFFNQKKCCWRSGMASFFFCTSRHVEQVVVLNACSH